MSFLRPKISNPNVLPLCQTAMVLQKRQIQSDREHMIQLPESGWAFSLSCF
jgi:hypothetical protein